MKRIFLTVLTILAVVMGAARAEDQAAAPMLAEVAAPAPPAAQGDKPTPVPPYLAPVPEYGRWTVSFKYDEADAAVGSDAAAASDAPKASAVPDGFPTLIETTKAGDMRTVALTFLKGAPKQFTCQQDWVLWSTPRGPKVIIADPSHMPYMYYTKGYALLEGVTIGAATFQETEDYNNAPAFHYKSGDTDVWIDVATMLPVGVKRGGVEAVYNFISTSKKITLKIPPDQAELLQKGLETEKYVRSLR